MITFVTNETIERYINEFSPEEKSAEELYEDNPNLFEKLVKLGRKHFKGKELIAFVTGLIMMYDLIELQTESDKRYEA